MIKYLNLCHEEPLDSFISLLETDEEHAKNIITNGDYNQKDYNELIKTIYNLRQAINSLSTLANYR